MKGEKERVFAYTFHTACDRHGFNLMKEWEKRFQSVDATSGAAPSRKEIIEDLFTTKLDTFLGISNHKDYRKKVIQRYMSGTPIAQELFLKYVKNNSMDELTKENTSYYTESKKKVFLNIGNDYTKKGKAVVFFHEYGHYIDHAAGDLSEDKIFRECLKNDFRKIMESRAKDLYISELSMQSTPADEKVNCLYGESALVMQVIVAVLRGESRVSLFLHFMELVLSKYSYSMMSSRDI